MMMACDGLHRLSIADRLLKYNGLQADEKVRFYYRVRENVCCMRSYCYLLLVIMFVTNNVFDVRLVLIGT